MHPPIKSLTAPVNSSIAACPAWLMPVHTMILRSASPPSTANVASVNPRKALPASPMTMSADGRFGTAATVKTPCSLIEQGAELGSMAGADCGGKLLLEGVNGATSAARADRSLSGDYCEWAVSPAHNQRVHSRARHIRPSKYADFLPVLANGPIIIPCA